MKIEIQIANSSKRRFLKCFCSRERKLLPKNSLRSGEGDPNCFKRGILGDVDSLLVEFDFSKGAAVEKHRLFWQRKNRMCSRNRAAVAVNIGAKFHVRVDVLKLPLAVDVGDVTARFDLYAIRFFVGLEFKMVACHILFPFARDSILNRRFSERRRATKRKAVGFSK